MKQWIEDLLRLQDNDLTIRRLTTRLEMIPIEISKIERDIETEREELKKRKEAGMSTELEIKQVESEIMKQNDEITRLQKQSVMVKKNDEYRALMKEINNAQAKISNLETRELELMDLKDAFKKTRKNEERITQDKENTLNEETQDLQDIEVRLKKEINNLNAGRNLLCDKIKEELLGKYTRLINKGVGKPLVEVHDGNCGNCHLKLTPQTVNTASKQEQIPCENCGHLLYS
jgi:uncharacterized protein